MSYKLPSNDKFIDPTSACLLNDFNYSMFLAKYSYDTESAISPPVAEFENQKLDISIPSMLLLPSIEHSYDIGPIMWILVTRFKYQTPNLPMLYLISVE